MRYFWCWLVLVMLTACSTIDAATPPATDATDTDSNGWQQVLPGIEQRLYRTDLTFFQTVRVDPTQVQFRVHYQPDNPMLIDEWQAALPDAQVIINTNFFDINNMVQGLLIADSITYGTPYRSRGGTFFVNTDDSVGIERSPYTGDPYWQAVQAFPMLIENGQPAYNNSNDRIPARRTLIGIDAQGRVVMMTTPGLGISLYGLSQYLATTDLNLVTALNLDGGGSSMLSIAASDTTVSSFDPVPAVLAVYPTLE